MPGVTSSVSREPAEARNVCLCELSEVPTWISAPAGFSK